MYLYRNLDPRFYTRNVLAADIPGRLGYQSMSSIWEVVRTAGCLLGIDFFEKLDVHFYMLAFCCSCSCSFFSAAISPCPLSP